MSTPLSPALTTFIREMPKIEIHVHLEGSVRPETLLMLANRHQIRLPADTVEGIQRWYTFRDFDHFIEIYMLISKCIRDVADIELIAREFLAGQAVQNIRYSEVTYTALTHYLTKHIGFDDQLAALNRARAWAQDTLGVDMGIVIDIPRIVTPDEGNIVAAWVAREYQQGKNGLVAFGLGGPEAGYPPERFESAFAITRAAGVPSVPHAGETAGPASIWGAIRSLGAVRIGHGVRCLEDPDLVDYLRENQIPLEVNPSSNVCLGVYPTLADHALPRLMAEGLTITINSDDPPMFNTTLTDEFLRVTAAFGFTGEQVERFVLNALGATFLPAAAKRDLAAEFALEFARLRYDLWG